ncbi:MAG: hypothetical protein U1F53_10570 [Burkholderiaceae bacterium]
MNAQIAAAAVENARAAICLVNGSYVNCPFNAIVRAGGGYQVMNYQTFTSVPLGNSTIEMEVYSSQAGSALYRWNKEIKLYKPRESGRFISLRWAPEKGALSLYQPNNVNSTGPGGDHHVSVSLKPASWPPPCCCHCPKPPSPPRPGQTRIAPRRSFLVSIEAAEDLPRGGQRRRLGHSRIHHHGLWQHAGGQLHFVDRACAGRSRGADRAHRERVLDGHLRAGHGVSTDGSLWTRSSTTGFTSFNHRGGVSVPLGNHTVSTAIYVGVAASLYNYNTTVQLYKK